MTHHPGRVAKHLVLVGLPGSGKSTVGSLVAARLGVPFVDVDLEIEHQTGQSPTEIFHDLGEAHFRVLESKVVVDQLRRPDPVVLAPGGGWAAQEGNLQTLVGRRLCIYLETSPEIAVARASRVGGRGRPVLPAGRELSAMEELLRNRKRYYATADLTVPTDNRTSTEVARLVVELARMNGAL